MNTSLFQRLASASVAAFITFAMLAGVNSLALNEVPVAQMATALAAQPA